MSDAATGTVGAWVGRVLTFGTLLAVVLVAIGLGTAVLSGATSADGLGASDLVAVLGRGGPASIIAGGLLVLTLIPLAALAAAAVAFARDGENRYLVISTTSLVLLVTGLVVAALVATSGGS